MSLRNGTQLGPYEIVAPLGAGGMGEVYRARDPRLKREVAIKVLPSTVSSDAERLRRFEQEALATAALNHPNILAVFDIGTHEGAPYVVSELLEGETLRERLRSGALPTRKALDYALQIAHGLAAAHGKGIVHRDLKPENIFLIKDGRVKILDFGLAKLTQPESGDQTAMATMTHATEAGVVLGTAGYMSPEQVRGVAVDARSDIFSFGAILYEMLSGKRAFHGETAADTMSAILKEDPAELSETNRNVSPALERIVQHCLEKAPEQRFHSASDIAFDLEHLTGISSSSAKLAPVAAAAPRRKWIGAAAIVLAVAAIALALGWKLGRGSDQTSLAEYKQVTFRTGSIGNARFTPDGSVVYSAAWDGGDNQLYLARTDDPGSRELGLKNAELLAISKSGELAVRLNTYGLTGYARGGTLARVPLSGGTPREVLENVQDADWSPNGDALAVIRYVPESSHWRLEYPIGKLLFDSIGWISQPKISPDGKWIAFGDHENQVGDDEGSVAVIAADGSDNGKDKKIASGYEAIEGIEWSTKGDEVWFCASKIGSALNPQAATLAGKVRTVTNVPGGVWLEDAQNGNLLTITHRETIGIRGLAPGAKEERELGWFGWSIPHGLSRDGHKMVFEEEGNGGGANYTVFLRDMDGSPPAKIGEGQPLAISPDGKWVVTRPAKGGPLSVIPTGAGEQRQLTHDNIRYSSVQYFDDGKHLLAAGIEEGHGRRDYLIDVSSGESKPVTPEGIAGVSISPDGKSVIVRSNGKLGIWPLDGSGLRPIPGPGASYQTDGWSPDGALIYVEPPGFDQRIAKEYKLSPVTGKMEFWRNFGQDSSAGITFSGGPRFSADGSAYDYIYVRILSEAFVVSGLR